MGKHNYLPAFGFSNKPLGNPSTILVIERGNWIIQNDSRTDFGWSLTQLRSQRGRRKFFHLRSKRRLQERSVLREVIFDADVGRTRRGRALLQPVVWKNRRQKDVR